MSELNYTGFEQYLELKESYQNGLHYVFRFKNHLGRSVVRYDYSFGGKRGLWELAVIEFDTNDEWDLTYDTPITSDVEGYLTDEEVRELLDRISKLKITYVEEES